MDVILLEDVKTLGKKGQIVKINDGYARNYVLPKKLGIEATAKNLNDLKLAKKREEKEAAEPDEDQSKDLKPKARRQYINAEDKEAITELYKAGREMEEIADVLGLYLSAVSRYIKEAGLGDERYKGKAIPSTGSAPVTAAVYNGGTGKKGTKGN